MDMKLPANYTAIFKKYGVNKRRSNKMAKKRGSVSPLGNAPGSQEAIADSNKNQIESLAKRLKLEAEKSETPLDEVLSKHLGVVSVGQSKIWTLKSGQKATFTPVTLSYEQLKSNTVVTFEINGREQSLLTEESLQDLSTLDDQQFYPAIGRRLADNKIDVLDGSRRRAYVLDKGGTINTFTMLVTDDEITLSDAKALATSLQSVKEHSLREIGLRLERDKETYFKEYGEKLTQAELAKRHGLSQSKVSKALQAATVDNDLISVFPDISLLNHSDYKILLSTQALLGDQLCDFTEDLKSKANELKIAKGLIKEDLKDMLSKLIANESRSFKPSVDKAVVTTLIKFENKDQFARKKVKGRNFSYEFGRIPKQIQEKLDTAINEVLSGLEN
ncbi:ParB family protein [Pseudoalteromonas gelatinilytica]|nr:ParB family protein [Pseudoalteromonas profundi]